MPKLKGKRIALISIGCNYPNSRYTLRGCANDAVDFSTTIVQLCDQSNIFVKLFLSLDSNGGNFPSRQHILGLLGQVINDCNNGRYSGFVFYFAGHGFQIPDNNGDESDRKDESVLGADGRIIKDDEFFQQLSHLKKGKEAIFVFDCCHSGSMLDLPRVPIGGDKSPGGKMNLNSKVVCISACADKEESIEKNGRGLFTSSFCSLLRKRGLQSRLFPILNNIDKYLKTQRTNMNVTVSCTNKVALRSSNILQLMSGKSQGKSRGGIRGNNNGNKPYHNQKRHSHSGITTRSVGGKKNCKRIIDKQRNNKKYSSFSGGCRKAHFKDCNLSIRGPWKPRAKRVAYTSNPCVRGNPSLHKKKPNRPSCAATDPKRKCGHV